MSTRNELFMSRFLPLNELSGNVTGDRAVVLSDRGAGADRLVDAVDWSDEVRAGEELVDVDRLVRMHIAFAVLALAGKTRYMPVLEAVVRNGNRRADSIRELSVSLRKRAATAARFYYRGVAALMSVFSPNENGGETHFA